jgi:hypothetical protein
MEPFDNPPREITTSIFFPSPEVLEEFFYSNNLARQNLPEYKVRLYKGGVQYGLCYFSVEVLRKYLDHPELFYVEDTMSGGNITSNPDYMSKFSYDELEKIDLISIDFGKRKLANGSVAVTALLIDLSRLHETEQKYWNSFEISEPVFAYVDSDYEKYFRRNFNGEWVDYNDPLGKCLLEIISINSLSGLSKKLFRNGQNPHLTYPILNTYKNFCDCCSELYKLVGPDNINIDAIKKILIDYFKYSDNDFVHKSGRQLSTLQVLEQLLTKLEDMRLLKTIKDVESYRIAADHKITEPESDNVDYIQNFRTICEELLDGLGVFSKRLEILLKNSK